MDARWAASRPPTFFIDCTLPYGSFGAGGTVTWTGGFFLSCSRSTSTAFSRLGSCPLATLSGLSTTSMSGATPMPSMSHLPSVERKRKAGVESEPPSRSGGLPESPIRPPQVRVPMSGPRPSFLK